VSSESIQPAEDPVSVTDEYLKNNETYVANFPGELPLPPEVTVDPATLPDADKEPLALARTQAAALDALAASNLAREILGAPIVDATLAVRRYEQKTYADADPEAVAAACRLAFSC